MLRYLSRTPVRGCPSDVRLVHNFYPGPHDDPGADRMVGLDGFRIWVTDEPGNDTRCHCGWMAESTTEPREDRRRRELVVDGEEAFGPLVGHAWLGS
jgi:hypothetical protein